MERVLAACAGFILAVLWFDLMFDVQVLGHSGEVLPEPVLASIAAYYERVTTRSGMAPLVGLVMFVTLGGAAWQALRGSGPAWLRGLALALCSAPILAAMLHIVPAAVRLGARGDPPAVQSELARGIFQFHGAAFAAMALFLAIQLAGDRRPADPEARSPTQDGRGSTGVEARR